MDFISKMERKFGRFAIPNLTAWLIGVYAVGYLIYYLANPLLYYLYLEPYMIFHYGQVWRLVTWIFTPPSASNIFVVLIMMLFYYSIGTNLENTWGAFRYNLYLIGGMLFTLIGAIVMYFALGQPVLLGGYFSTYYINTSIFLAFAVLYPNMQVLLYFIIPIKIKWLAYLYGAYLIYDIITANIVGKVAIVVSMLNFLIFFLLVLKRKKSGIYGNYKSYNSQRARRDFKRDFNKRFNEGSFGGNTGSFNRGRQQVTKHKCAICGRTENDGDELEFRFCSKCNGNYEYCQDHLFTHVHRK
ncbi:Membrane associated serine protease, rhomboid family [Acetitomaculum ruminis DSM 5522]|uniref:Membrane associated serine protease, rhomboid family n=1 Tax=Acetitomaculum ruminis DSM 5522 TaxID=1120918 RepID=A0A1I0V215_9FIRM|nr:hypothetical protein [Acetitomaculum ruminis]SFA70331.1 Membrane associated serine protease, rhomboid family [Acetitomaculum ruminis DSM 5522]